MDYVTGAVFAIRRTAWTALGTFDDDFYPAYFEETDYCYRARHRGLKVLYVPEARARHLMSNRAWRLDPLLHCVQQHRSRYRFVAKHFAMPELATFFAAEQASLEQETWFDQAMGRALAARQTIRRLDTILVRRQQDMQGVVQPAQRRLLQVGFAELSRTAVHRSARLAQQDFSESLPRRVRRRLGLLPAEAPHQPPSADQRAAQLKVLELLATYDER
jgi:cellulose synthase/poly-beta-1,6-N-acetylglucosamine synthase-like glycosyltransferase